MAEKTFWMRNLFGHKALVIGAAERDRWIPRGWVDSDEPTDGDQVHMENASDEVNGRPLIPWGARDYWQGKGFAPSPPEEPINPTKDPALVDVPDESVKPKTSAPAPKTEKSEQSPPR